MENKRRGLIEKVGLVRRDEGGALHVENWWISGVYPEAEGYTVAELELIMRLHNVGLYRCC